MIQLPNYTTRTQNINDIYIRNTYWKKKKKSHIIEHRTLSALIQTELQDSEKMKYGERFC